MRNTDTEPLPVPPLPNASVTPESVAVGPPIPPIERLRLFSDQQWEEFVLEWANSLSKEYARVERQGGAGDKGRDVVAYCNETRESPWDNYQCKHYDHPLRPTDVWLELGKLVFYTGRGDYAYPRRYYFVAPQGAGTTLSNLMRRPEELRQGLVDNWVKYCQNSITSESEVDCDEALLTYIRSLDFSIFTSKSPLTLIDEHAKTRYYSARFGGGLPKRPDALPPPQQPVAGEAVYVRELLDAYNDHLKVDIAEHEDIPDPNLSEHFSDSRQEFYSAESLRLFSRDTLPPGEFARLQDEFHDGIKDEIRSDHADGYRRVLGVVRTARLLQLSDHPLVTRLAVKDRGGICHQLANDGKVKWVK